MARVDGQRQMILGQGGKSSAVRDAHRPARGDPFRGRVRTGRLEPWRCAAAERWTQTKEDQPDDGSTQTKAEDADDG